MRGSTNSWRCYLPSSPRSGIKTCGLPGSRILVLGSWKMNAIVVGGEMTALQMVTVRMFFAVTAYLELVKP